MVWVESRGLLLHRRVDSDEKEPENFCALLNSDTLKVRTAQHLLVLVYSCKVHVHCSCIALVVLQMETENEASAWKLGMRQVNGKLGMRFVYKNCE